MAYILIPLVLFLSLKEIIEHHHHHHANFAQHPAILDLDLDGTLPDPHPILIDASAVPERTRAGIDHAFEGLVPMVDKGVFRFLENVIDEGDYPLLSYLMHDMTNRTVDLSPSGNVKPSTATDFLATFAPGGANAERLHPWPGMFRMPPTGATYGLPAGGAELTVDSEQPMDVLPGMRLRTETGGTIEALTNGSITQCLGPCGQTGSELKRFLHAGAATGFGPAEDGFAFEFAEIRFHDAMRVMFTGDAPCVLTLPAKKAWTVANRGVGPHGNVTDVPRAQDDVGDYRGGGRECGDRVLKLKAKRGQEEETVSTFVPVWAAPRKWSGGGLDENVAEDAMADEASILQFERWDAGRYGPFPECLPLRPVNTVADFAGLLFASRNASVAASRRA